MRARLVALNLISTCQEKSSEAATLSIRVASLESRLLAKDEMISELQDGNKRHRQSSLLLEKKYVHI